jgi:hypothetical protein
VALVKTFPSRFTPTALKSNGDCGDCLLVARCKRKQNEHCPEKGPAWPLESHLQKLWSDGLLHGGGCGVGMGSEEPEGGMS